MTRFLITLLLTLATATLSAQDKQWFTVVLFGDPEIDMGGDDRPNNNCDATTITRWFNGIIGMGKTGGLNFSFSNAPDTYTPQANLVICMGDMDADSQTSNSDLETAFNMFNNNSIPFVTMLGNHDKVPDKWNGGDLGPTFLGGYPADKYAISLSKTYRDNAKNLTGGITDLTEYTHSQGDVHVTPFAFTYKGVRFFIGQNYWFQKTYTHKLIGTPKHYAPNEVITALSNDVLSYTNTPSVWVQHYPINCADRWWNEENASGKNITPYNTPDYSTAAEKRAKYKELIASTKNPQHFSGHDHTQRRDNFTQGTTTFSDYVAPYFAACGGAFIALCNNVDGVVEVRAVNFDPTDQQYNTVNGLTHLSNDKLYAIHTNGRGNLRHKDDNTFVTSLNTDPFNFTDTHQQWAILEYSGKRYLFNYGARKFASRNGERLDLVDVPGTDAETTVGYIDNTMNYPWTLQYGSLHLNLDNSGTRGYAVNTWSTLDDGNQFAITEVGNFSDRSTILAENLTVQVQDATTHEVLSETTLPVAVVGAKVQTMVSMPAGYVFDSAPVTTVAAGTTTYTIYAKAATSLDDLTTGWYQIVVGANNNATYIGNYLRTHETGVARGNGTYDVTMSDNKTDLSTLFYVEKNGEGTDATYSYTLKNQTGYYWDGAGSRLGTSTVTQYKTWRKMQFTEPDAADIHIKGGVDLMVFEEGATPLVGGASQGSGNTRWNFLPADELLAGRDVYTVEYANDVSSAVTVTYNNASYTGIKTVVNGGVFFLSSVPTSSDFTCTGDAVVAVDAANKRLVVSADAVEAARAVLNMRGVGFPKTTSAEYIALNTRISEYDVVKGGGTVAPDYSTHFDAVASTRSDRHTDNIQITINGNTQTITVSQAAGPVYFDLTAQTFTCEPGVEITPVINYTGEWMNRYVYIDENKNGFEVADADIDGTVLKTGTDIDLKAYSRYAVGSSNYNSKGESVANTNKILPTFTAPSAAGTYRMRFKVDWGCIDPAGRYNYPTASDSNNNTDANGGTIVDVTLVVGTPPAIDPIYITNVQTALAAYYNCTDIETPQDGNYYSVASAGAEATAYLAKDNGDNTFRLVGPQAKYSNGASFTDSYSAANNLTVAKYDTGEANFGAVTLSGAPNATYWADIAAPAPITPIYKGGAARTIVMTLPGVNTEHVAVYIGDVKQTVTVTPGDDTQVLLPAVESGTVFTVFVGDGEIVREISYTRPDAYYVTVHHRIYGSDTDDFGSLVEEVEATEATAWSPRYVTVPAGYTVRGGVWPQRNIIADDLNELVIEYEFNAANMPIQASEKGTDGFPVAPQYYTMTLNGKDAYFNFTTASGVSTNQIKLATRDPRDLCDYFYFMGDNIDGFTIHSAAVSPGLSYDVRATRFNKAVNKYVLLDTYDGATHKYVFREVGSSALINENNGSENVLAMWDSEPDVTADKALFTFTAAGDEAATAVAALSLPVAGKYYYMKNCNPNFTSTKSLWLNWGTPGWKEFSATDLCEIWEMIPADGGYAMRNMGCQRYLQNKTSSSTAQAVSYLFAMQLTPGNVQFGISTSAEEGLHANGHGGTSPAASGNTNANWFAVANTPSAWQIVEPDNDEYTAIANYWDNLISSRYTDDWLSADEQAARDAAVAGIAGDGLKSSDNLKALIAQLAVLDTPKPKRFYRIKGSSGKYVYSLTYNNQGDNGYYLMGDNDEEHKLDVVWYFNEDNEFVGYKNGKGIVSSYQQAAVGVARNKFTFETEMFARPFLSMKTDFAASPYTYDATTLLSRNSLIPTSNPAAYGWTFETMTTLPVKVTSVGYATLYTPVTLTVPDGVTAYACSKNDDSLEMTPVSTISAGQGVILKAAEGTYDFPIEGEDNGAASVLSGLTAAAVSSTGDYFLSVGTIGGVADQVGFFPVRTNEVLSAFKSYLANGTQQVAAFRFSFKEIATAIDAAADTSLNEGVTYNLNGQRVQRAHGAVIINGKKIIIK